MYSTFQKIKVSGLINKCYNQINPIIAWIMIHNIAAMYRYLKSKEKLQAYIATQNLNSTPNSCVSS